MRGWRVEVDGFGVMAAAAQSRGKATHMAVKSARDAGYSGVGYNRVRVTRCKEIDVWAGAVGRPTLVLMRYAKVLDG